ncbi:MAG: ATP-binding protein [Propionivibrio sp.]
MPTVPDKPLRRAPSLRWRLLTLVSIAALVVVVLAGALSYRQARHEVQEMMDSQMSRLAALVLVHAQQGDDHLAQLPANLARLHGQRSRGNGMTLEFQIGRPDGTLLAHSPNAPLAPIGGELGFGTIEHKNQPWRSLILETDDRTLRVQVSQSITKRNNEALEIAAKTVQPLGVIFPLLLLAIYFSVRRGLKPLDDLTAEVLSRSPENLSPLAGTAAPREALPLVAALDRLLFRLNGSLENERRFTADAAHELRTPLAAARVQTQVALLSKDAGQRDHALAQTLAGLDRATRLVEQMLRLARLDPLAALPSAAQVDLCELLRDVVAGARDASSRCVIESEIGVDAATITGDSDLLRIALRNLVDNAVRYSPPGSRVSVALRREEPPNGERGALAMSVSDNGPGVSEAELPRLTERFFRSADAVAEGSGLGLTIVHRIAELHGASLELKNRAEGGFEAVLRWQSGR